MATRATIHNSCTMLCLFTNTMNMHEGQPPRKGAKITKWLLTNQIEFAIVSTPKITTASMTYHKQQQSNGSYTGKRGCKLEQPQNSSHRSWFQQLVVQVSRKYFAFSRVCQLHQVTHISKGINTERISNNDLFACRLSYRLDLDLVCISKS